MKRWKKVLLIILFVVLVLLAMVLIARWINKGIAAKDSAVHASTRAVNKIYDEINEDAPEDSQITGVQIEKIREGRVVGYHLTPYNHRHSGAVVVFGGSEGSANVPLAAQIAQQGHEVFAMYYFGQDNLPPELAEVPLEIFQDIHAYVKEHAKSIEPLTVVGGSKGAEFGLLLGATYPDLIDNLILYAPTSHVFQGLSFESREGKSSWTLDDKDVPFIAFDQGSGKAGITFLLRMIVNKPYEYGPMYESALAGASNAEEARIKIENFKGNILLFAGGKDAMWPSAKMARDIQETYPKAEVEIFANAGHLFYGPPVVEGIEMGGDYEANEKAKPLSDRILFKTLDTWTTATK